MAASSRVPPHRMKLAHPNEFEPKAVFFYTFPSSEKEWIECFKMKAAAVYSAISGKGVDNDTVSIASKLLISIANNCGSKPEGVATTTTTVKQTMTTTASAKKPTLMTTAAMTAMPPSEEVTKEDVEKLQPDVKQKIDAVYFLVAFLRDLKESVYKGEWNRDKVDDLVISRYGHNVVFDMAKLENQLPLTLLIDVLNGIPEAVKMATIECEKYAKEDQTLLDTMKIFKLNFYENTFYQVAHIFYWYYSPFYSKNTQAGLSFKDTFKSKTHLLECLHYSLVDKCIADTGYPEIKHFSPTPMAKQLASSGIRFQSDDNGSAGVKFDGDNNVVQLPTVIFDSKLETVVRNLIAWEWWSGEKQVTRHFQFVNELIEDVGDLRVMKKFGILKGKLKKVKEVVELVKRIDGFESYPSIYPAMDSEISKMKECYDKRMSMFFVRNQQAVLWVSSVAATSLLVTAICVAKRRW